MTTEKENTCNILGNNKLLIDVLINDYSSARRLADYYKSLADKFIADRSLVDEAGGFIKRASGYINEAHKIGKKMMKAVAKNIIDEKALMSLKATAPSDYFMIKDMSNGIGIDTVGHSPLWGNDFSAEKAPQLLLKKAEALGVLKNTVKLQFYLLTQAELRI